MKQTYVRTSTLIVAAALAVACGSDDGMDEPMPVPGEEDASSSCPPGTPEFTTGAAGYTVSDEAMTLKVRIDAADSSPPEKDYNTWQVAITDVNGAPLPQVQVTWACAWMDAHGHGVNPKAIEKLPDGRISLVDQNLAMNGGWKVRLWVDPTGAGAPFAGGSESRNPNACMAPSNETWNIEFDVCVPRDPDEI